MEELYGIFIVYELRLGIDKSSKEEATFKVIKKRKKLEANISGQPSRRI